MSSFHNVNHEEFDPLLKSHGMRNVVGSPQRGISMQMIGSYTKTGTGAEVVTLADQGLKGMASATYAVLIICTAGGAPGTFAAASAVTATTFTIPAATFANADTLVILVIGNTTGSVPLSSGTV